MTGGVPSRYPGRGERWALVALLILSIGFGAITLARSAFMHSRHTDADVYFRVVRAKGDSCGCFAPTRGNLQAVRAACLNTPAGALAYNLGRSTRTQKGGIS